MGLLSFALFVMAVVSYPRHSQRVNFGLFKYASLFMLGGAGTTCVVLAAERWSDSMSALVPYIWTYVIFVLATIGTGVMMVRAIVLLARGRAKVDRLRDSSMPVDAVTFTGC